MTHFSIEFCAASEQAARQSGEVSSRVAGLRIPHPAAFSARLAHPETSHLCYTQVTSPLRNASLLRFGGNNLPASRHISSRLFSSPLWWIPGRITEVLLLAYPCCFDNGITFVGNDYGSNGPVPLGTVTVFGFRKTKCSGGAQNADRAAWPSALDTSLPPASP
ncbi:hypothetical protein B5X24_HaOG202444 [Helicoverpa armigera]|nr:hypothetical protein B5X24_HaOG202444 [Helicoverpa armigera]